MTFLADLLSSVFERHLGREKTAATDDGRPLVDLAQALLRTSGETSGQAMAREILARFDDLEDTEKLDLFRGIATAMNIDPNAVRIALDAYEQDPTETSYRAFATAAEPKRQELIRRLNRVPGATGELVKMRADLLRLGGNEPDLKALDLDFRHLFASWFNRGFLVLRPINWESPAHILEKIIAYEAVHAIDTWDDLRRRLEPPDRRCFAFFHPSIPNEPLIFVEVALNKGIPGAIQDLLAEDRGITPAEEADTAVFYSISNCQAGLAGISFGNSLIKQAACDLAAELPELNTFVTLSPIPGLNKWLAEHGLSGSIDESETMEKIAAYYLLNAKNSDGLPFDPVARFHLGNGAIIHAVHADADVSERGVTQSGGTMVNYLYDLAKVAQNHERFASKCEIVVSADVKTMAKSVVLPTIDER